MTPFARIADELRRAHALVHGIGRTGWAGVDAHVARALADLRLALRALGEDDPSWEEMVEPDQGAGR
ncbi:MAG: hypothetical protein HYV94_01490 [Candidatus Rokubacteria bacterium]|nr:hypothetical protein [Candidatus Rokubacteria bacterium]